MKLKLVVLVGFMLSLGSAVHALQDSSRSRIEALEQRVSSILSKAGIHFGGQFRSQFLLSRIDSTSPGIAHDAKADESVEYTSVDFDIKARPNEAISGRLVFRMHQDWRNFFSDISNPIFTRWISIDGTVAKMFSYNVGDFRQRYSPLTLWSPDINIAYEPRIFSRLRHEAMAEEFLGDNDRILQGLNMNFDAEIAPIFKELHFNLLGTRLRLSEASIQNGSGVANVLETAPMDRYLVGTNLDITIIPGMSVGGSFLDAFDSKPTYGGDDIKRDTLAKQTAVWAGRGGVGTALFLDPDRICLTLRAEVAQSLDDSSWYALDSADNDNDGTNDTLLSRTLTSSNIQGTALAIDVDGMIRIGSLARLTIGAGYLQNDKEFRNEMAQSPTFLGQRIMNIENDIGSGGMLYSTYDAMYRHVFKFAPSQQFVNRSQIDTLGWFKTPMRKISYTNAILTLDEVRASGALDPSVQLVMPFGAATPNRAGGRGSIGIGLFDDGVKLGARGLVAQEREGALVRAARLVADTLQFDATESSMPVTEFLEIGGGFSVDVSSFVKPMTRALEVRTGYTLAQATNGGISGYPLSEHSTTTGFLNAGLYYNFWKRASLLLGYQQIDTKMDTYISADVLRTVQTHWAVGLEYKVTEGGVLSGSVGKVDVAFSDDNASTTGNTDPSANDFDQWQFELFLTVGF